MVLEDLLHSELELALIDAGEAGHVAVVKFTELLADLDDLQVCVVGSAWRHHRMSVEQPSELWRRPQLISCDHASSSCLELDDQQKLLWSNPIRDALD